MSGSTRTWIEENLGVRFDHNRAATAASVAATVAAGRIPQGLIATTNGTNTITLGSSGTSGSTSVVIPDDVYQSTFDMSTITAVQMAPPTQATVKEIHDAFMSEVDNLMLTANGIVEEEVGDTGLVKKADKLIALGFTNAKDVQASKMERERLRVAREKIERTKQLIGAIEYFQQKYPNYKFITEESVIELTNKYGLVYGEASHYTGNIPDKNLADIEAMKIDALDECHHVSVFKDNRGFVSGIRRRARVEYTGEPGLLLKLNEVQRQVHGNNTGSTSSIDDMQRLMRSTILSGTITIAGGGSDHVTSGKCELEIVAPLSDFDMVNMERVGNEMLQTFTIPDPIVLKPVHYDGKKHYLIITAWGDEASDEMVVNEKMN